MIKKLIARAPLFALIIFFIVAVGTVAVKAVANAKQKVEVKRVPENRWYSLTPTNSSNHANQIISGLLTSPPDEFGMDCAQRDNAGNYCAVFLQVDSEVTIPDDTSVADAIDFYGAEIASDADGDGYSRLPL